MPQFTASASITYRKELSDTYTSATHICGNSAVMRTCIAGLLCIVWASIAAAHTMTVTRILVTFASSERVEVKVDIDLTQILGSSERYYEIAVEPVAAQGEDIKRIVPKLLDSLRLYTGGQQLTLEFKEFVASRADKAIFIDGSISNLSTFRFFAHYPGNADPLKLVVPHGAPIDYPIALTVQIPAAHVSTTRWLQPGVHESEPFIWAASNTRSTSPPSSVPASPLMAPIFDSDLLPWWRQANLYLRLGFRHIVPEGTDHILFVLGLFFLGGVGWLRNRACFRSRIAIPCSLVIAGI